MKHRSRKYRTADGDYLMIDTDAGREDRYRLVWFIPEWQDIGGHVGDDAPGPTPPEDKSEWESWQAARSVKNLADGRDCDGYYFDSISRARAALAAANEGLLSGEAPWPAWALLAKAEGWTPPEGWKP
jgi:hypothetical protein